MTKVVSSLECLRIRKGALDVQMTLEMHGQILTQKRTPVDVSAYLQHTGISC